MRLKREVTSFSGVKKVKIVPHISIRATFETKDIKALSKELSTLAKQFMPFEIAFKRYGVWAKKYVVLEVVKTEKLKKLHELILKLVDKYRTISVQEIYKETLHKLTKKQKLYLKLHGYPYCLDFYSPHVTLAYEIDSQRITKVKRFLLKQKLPRSIKIDGITLLKKNKTWKIEYKKKFG